MSRKCSLNPRIHLRTMPLKGSFLLCALNYCALQATVLGSSNMHGTSADPIRSRKTTGLPGNLQLLGACNSPSNTFIRNTSAGPDRPVFRSHSLSTSFTTVKHWVGCGDEKQGHEASFLRLKQWESMLNAGIPREEVYPGNDWNEAVGRTLPALSLS
jgi:hypothetical protein